MFSADGSIPVTIAPSRDKDSDSSPPPQLYVSLIVHTIRGIPPLNNGFVLQDFPNTKRQALLLMEALSGIRYDIKKRQVSDSQSVYAPFGPCEEVLYDIKKCGLDVIVYTDMMSTCPNGTDSQDDGLMSSTGDDVSASLDERVRARRNLFTGEVEYVADECSSVRGLQEVFSLARPYHTSGLDLTAAERSNSELRDLFNRFNVLDTLYVKSFATLADAARSKVCELRDRFIPPCNLEPGYLQGVVAVEEGAEAQQEYEGEELDEGPEDSVGGGDLIDEGQKGDELEGAAMADADGLTAAVRPRPPPVRLVNSVPIKLASCLARMWGHSEQQSQLKSRNFFNAFRDLRYQFVQRRRCAADCLNYMLIQLDRRQELFDAFRTDFNALEGYMRFDPDCIGELQLQVVELGDAIYRESEGRRHAALEYVKQVAADAVLALAVHRCNCEAASLAQSEFNRFYVALHLLFDFAKSVKGFELQSRAVNELEASMPLVLPSLDAAALPAGKGKEGKSGGGKEKEAAKKGGKNDAAKSVPVPFREAIPPVLLSMSSVSAMPEPKAAEVVVDPKAKKPPKVSER